MISATASVVAVLASCLVFTSAAPQNYVQYVPQGAPQHYGVLNPASYATGYTPSIYPMSGGYNPYTPINYNPSYNPSYNPNYNQQPFYFGANPMAGGQQPQFVFVYPMPGHGQHVPSAPTPSAPLPPPIDETGDSETVSVTATKDDSSEREQLSPGNELNKKGVPEKHTLASRIHALEGFMSKAAVQSRPAPLLERKREAKPQDIRRDSSFRSRMGTPAAAPESDASEAEERQLAESIAARLRTESRGWRRRLAPNYQSVYLDAEDPLDDDDKKKDDTVVISGNETPAGPSVASVKPAAIALAGPGGVASASPTGTAVVGPGGLAVAAPSATAVAGPSGGVPPGTLGAGAASARSNLRLHQILEALYAKPARRAALRAAPSALAFDDDEEDY